jgi:uncharacterized membrane protein (DUF106 family)
MNKQIFKNSFFVFLLTFIVFYIIFVVINSRKVRGEFRNPLTVGSTWKYPLAIALVVWIIWYFFVFPPNGNCLFKKIQKNKTDVCSQKINMQNWI